MKWKVNQFPFPLELRAKRHEKITFRTLTRKEKKSAPEQRTDFKFKNDDF